MLAHFEISVFFYLSTQFVMDRKQCCVKLSVQPSRALVDEKFIILVQNLFPGSQLTVCAFYKCEDGHSWEAFAHYTADATGAVNGRTQKNQEHSFRNVCRHHEFGNFYFTVSEDPSLGGTYSGVEPMGLLWSLRPVPGSKPGLR